MKRPPSPIARWTEGPVDTLCEHFELRFGPSGLGGSYDWRDLLVVALIGPPSKRCINVEFLVDRDSPEHEQAVAKVVEDIEFYLIEKPEPDPWGYAQYHCGTLANVYSHVHWGYFVSSPEQATPPSQERDVRGGK